MPKPSAPVTDLKRQGAGHYSTPDGRFTVDRASGGWMVTDTEHTNELGLPLVRGPFATLDGARAVIEAARVDPAPTSDLAARIAALPPSTPGSRRRKTVGTTSERREARPGDSPPQVPEPPPIVIREWRRADGEALRRLWAEVGMRSIGDDDAGLATMARRNPGLVLVATIGGRIVGSALGGWDGRRGWIYHVAAAPDQRRQGIGRLLVARIEEGLRAVGCRKVNVTVDESHVDGAAFWEAAGYAASALRHFGRVLPGQEPGPDGAG